MPSLRMRRRLKAGTQPLELLPSLLPLGKDTPEAQPPVSPAPQTPSPSLLRRGGAVAGAALMASVIPVPAYSTQRITLVVRMFLGLSFYFFCYKSELRFLATDSPDKFTAVFREFNV